MVRLGEIVPDFQAQTTVGDIDFHQEIEDSWVMLFSHPADFTPVCTTELGEVGRLQQEFEKRGFKLFALSCNDVELHNQWVHDIEAYSNSTINYPIISDPLRDVANLYGMLDPDAKDSQGIPLTCRAVFIIGPDKRLRCSFLYPATTGRNFPEILRAIDSIQLTEDKPLATPVNWKPGEDVIVAPNLPPDEAYQRYPQHRIIDLPSGRPYLRFTKPN